MSSGYVKLFTNILDSSVWVLSKEAKIVWITLLTMKGRDQVVRAAIPALARRAVLTIEETQKGLEELLKEDPWSKSKEHNGKRILPVDGGWFVVTGEKYRNLMSKEDRKEYKRMWIANRRKREREAKALSLQKPPTTVSPSVAEVSSPAASKSDFSSGQPPAEKSVPVHTIAVGIPASPLVFVNSPAPVASAPPEEEIPEPPDESEEEYED